MQFETLRMKKVNLLEGIKKFNEKPKKGIQFLLDSNAIASRTPVDIASFLLATEGLDKHMIGEFLGEGNEENIAIMHAFVDLQDFSNLQFVSALRMFLQHFRLPGEAQKIDRFMLKFADRYLHQNPGKFSSADTGYVLAYSVIMLNTDQHNAQVKVRMTKQDFLKNNRGIDGDQDLPVDFMEEIFDEIRAHEIVLKDERPAVDLSLAGGPASAKFEKASAGMAQKTEERLKEGIRKRVQAVGAFPNAAVAAVGGGGDDDLSQFNHPGNSGIFYSATHYEHVKSMFESVWMSVFTALSGYLQDSEDPDAIALALQGFQHALTLACMFDMDLERRAFLSTLSKFAQLNPAGGVVQVRHKNLEAVRVLLEVSTRLGGRLGDGWMEIALCISNLEKLQTVDSSSKVRNSSDRRASSTPRKDTSTPATPKYSDEALAVATSQKMTILVDKIFTTSVRLSGPAIVGFVKALCEVSWDEITSSENSQHPRMYCLQRLIEISYYNMNRIRVEWSQLWAILGPHFTQAACHDNSLVSFFALDKLRQLAIKFLELDELSNFKFQRDFLKPFEVVVGTSRDPKMKDMALVCLKQMVQGKARQIKSGWKAIFATLMKAAKDENEQVVALAFDMVKMIFNNHFDEIIANGGFPDFISCLVCFCKNGKSAKTGLHSVELLKQTVPRIFEMLQTSAGSKMLHATAAATAALTKPKPEIPSVIAATLLGDKTPEDATNQQHQPTAEETSFRFIFPVLFGFQEVTISCDLEVRTRGLVYLFDVLKTHGLEFSHDAWEVIAKGILFPMFDDLKLSRQEHRTIDEREDLTVWLSTTLIQALRLLVELFGFHFGRLGFAVEGLFEILVACMTQENETLARIGSTCLHQFIETNVDRFDTRTRDRVCNTFVNLFAITTPTLLFFDYRAQVPEAPSGVMAPPEGDEADALESKHDTDHHDRDVGSESMAQHMTSVTSLTGRAGSPTNELVFVDHAVQLEGRPRPEPQDFQGIILKCVLHLLVVQTLHDTLTTSAVAVSRSTPRLAAEGEVAPAVVEDKTYRALSVNQLLVLVGCFERSYRFAEAFNRDVELRLTLFRMGFMKQLPNLLKQECASVIAYISILFKMVMDTQMDRVEKREEVAGLLIPLCLQVLHNFNTMEPGVKNRNVNAWKPVVILILTALSDMDDALFAQHLPRLYEETVGILLQPELDLEIRIALHAFVIRVGTAVGVITTGA
ncbi:guanine nucleotide exchange protein for ADP-robosylation factor [Podochytrium sp. JEL0797]|nr:guanine nucleotide exchange protein for ADP-robosylation factor [Podochytrium sp. JEL0797]